jgi:hypothetical protein
MIPVRSLEHQLFHQLSQLGFFQPDIANTLQPQPGVALRRNVCVEHTQCDLRCNNTVGTTTWP